MRVGTLNCNSLVNKTAGILEHLSDQLVDVCLLQETYLRKGDDAKIQEMKDRGWEIYSAPRKQRIGGGVAIIYKADLGVKNCGAKSFKTFESIEATIGNSTELIRLVNIYRPPYSKRAPHTQSQFLAEFKEYQEELDDKVGKTLVMGDFNFHMERPSEFYPKKLQELLEESGLSQLVPIKPTHAHGGTLDLIITSTECKDLCGEVEVISEGTTSDHHLVRVDLKLQSAVTKRRRPGTVWYRDLNDLDLEKMIEDLNQSDLLTADTSDLGTDALTEKFFKTLLEVFDKHCPMKKRRKKEKYTPWMDEELRTLRKRKRQAERKWRKASKKRQDQDKTRLKAQYVELRSQFQKLETQKRAEYVRENITRCGQDAKRLNQQLSRLLGKTSEVLPDMENRGKLAEDFGDFFLTKINKLQERIDVKMGEMRLQEVDLDMHTDDDKATVKMEQFNQLNEEEVSKLVRGLPNKSCDLDPIPTSLLKQLLPTLLPVLTKLVNSSLHNGIFPSDLKQAIVRPTVKNASGDVDSLSNYRPVSNLSVLSKVLEKAVSIQLAEHLVRNNLQGDCQSGFRQGHSCETHMVRVVDDVLSEMDKGNVVAVIQIDLSAAFDTIDHGKLLRRLEERYGLGSTVLAWFSSYLSNRSYKVKIEDSLSPEFLLKYGVPQGSLLGPVLFTLYVEPLEPIVKAFGLTIRLYADDSTIYLGFCPVEGWSGSKKNIEACLETVRSWMIENRLMVNEDKTEFLILGKRSKTERIHEEEDLTVELSGNIIERTDPSGKAGKTLGVYLDTQMDMKRQISMVKRSTAVTMRNLWQIRRFIDKPLRLMLASQLVISKVDYCNALYFNLPATTIKPLKGIMNQVIRFIHGIRERKVDLEPFYKDSHVLTVEKRIFFKICVLGYKMVYGYAPQYLQDLVCVDDNTNVQKSTRQNSKVDHYKLKPPSGNVKVSKLGKRRISQYLPEVWNCLPENLRDSPTEDTFRSNLKTLLFDATVRHSERPNLVFDIVF